MLVQMYPPDMFGLLTTLAGTSVPLLYAKGENGLHSLSYDSVLLVLLTTENIKKKM